MDENNFDVTNELVDEALNNVEVTDLLSTDGGEIEAPKIGATEVAIGALAVVGAGFILKKAYDGGKWVAGKISSGWKKIRGKDGEPEVEIEDADIEPDDQEVEVEAEVQESNKD